MRPFCSSWLNFCKSRASCLSAEVAVGLFACSIIGFATACTCTAARFSAAASFRAASERSSGVSIATYSKAHSAASAKKRPVRAPRPERIQRRRANLPQAETPRRRAPPPETLPRRSPSARRLVDSGQPVLQTVEAPVDAPGDLRVGIALQQRKRGGQSDRRPRSTPPAAKDARPTNPPSRRPAAKCPKQSRCIRPPRRHATSASSECAAETGQGRA